MLEVLTAHESHPGGRRRNEDACGYRVCGNTYCWCVSDGAGGHGSGDVAAALVVDTVLEHFAADPGVSAERVVNLLEAAHQVVMQAKQVQGADDMHATCVVLILDSSRHLAVWGHAGDSRVYFFRGAELISQTRDHSLVQSMIDAGYGDQGMTRTHPQRSLLLSAIGSAGELTVGVSGQAQVVMAGDAFLLCTDGWWEPVLEAKMQDSLMHNPDPAEWLAAMAAIARQESELGHDNYTAMAVSLQEGGLSPTLIKPAAG